MKMTPRDIRRAAGVHSDLMTVATLAWRMFDGGPVLGMPGTKLVVTATGGVRTDEQQREILKRGASWTLDSRHLTGHALDFAIVTAREMIDSDDAYWKVWIACWRPASIICEIPIEWGGYWPKPRADGYHIQLPRKEYPA